MNNQENKRNRSLLDQERAGSNAQYQGFTQGVGQDAALARANSGNLRGQIESRYSDPNNFMPAGLQPNANGWFNLPGGNDPLPSVGADYSGSKSGYQGFADTGGRENFDESAGYMRGLAGGNIGNVDDIRYRATSVIPSFYKSMKNQMNRRSNVQGGFSPGFDAQSAELARQSGRESYNASRTAEADIADRRLDAMKFGAGGLGNIDSQVQSGKLAGLGGLKGISDSELSASGMNANLAEGRNARNQGAQLDLARMYQQGGITGAAGLSSLYGQDRNDLGNANNSFLQALASRYGLNLNNIMGRSSIKDKHWTDYIPQALDVGGTVATGMGGG